MIHKHAVSLLVLTFLAGISVFAQPSNVVKSPAINHPPKAQKIGQLGDPAPPLTVHEWIKGKPVKIHPGTNFYAIVFCTLSKANEFALTNLSALQKQYQEKGLVIVVISDDPPEQLRDFVQMRGADINFTVAADDLPGRTARNYEIAFGQYMPPLAYVVSQEGKVLWLGHPLTDGLGWVVEDIVSHRFNLEQTRKTVLSRQQMKEYLMLARNQDPQVEQAGRILLQLRSNDASALCDLAFKIATDPYIEKRDVALATLALDRAAQLSTTNTTDIAVDRALLLFQTGQQAAGLARAKQALTTARTDEDKSEVKSCIHAMEARLTAERTTPANPPGGTNLPGGKLNP